MMPGAFFLGVFLLSLSSCTFSTGSTEARDFSRVDAYLRAGKPEAARAELNKWVRDGTLVQSSRAGLMLCEFQSHHEQGGCYKTLHEKLANSTDIDEIADLYALSLYRFYLHQDLETRLSGLMKLSLQCPGTPAGLKAINYLKGHWNTFDPKPRLNAWLKWGAQVQGIEVVRCRADSDVSQVVAVVALERADAYVALGDFKNAAKQLEEIWATVEQSVWWDDVAMAWADALFSDGQWVKALDVLKLFLERRESSFFIGSYESVHFDEAMMMRGQIFEAMKKPLDAREEYLNLVDRAPDSRWCDDAAYRAALLLSKDKKQKALRQFIEDYPESKWARVAQKALEL